MIAIDPASHMHPVMGELFESGKAEHFRMKGEESLEELKRRFDDQISVYVCDMNNDMEAKP